MQSDVIFLSKIDEDEETENTSNLLTTTNENEKKRKNGKRNRHSKFAQNNQNNNNNCANKRKQKTNQNVTSSKSRLLRELHEREQVRGMNRFEARQLIQDKLLFRGETDIGDLRLRRYCVVVLSKEMFELENSMKIPSEVVSISMENGKISSILRLIPFSDESPSFQLQESLFNDKYRMKTMKWNPMQVKDTNMMFKLWSHFLDRCFYSLLLIPLSQNNQLIEFLRNLNEIRSILNNRLTVSICLSRVIAVEDFLLSLQQLKDTYIVSSSIPLRKSLETINYGHEICNYFIRWMKIIATESNSKTKTAEQYSRLDEWKRNEQGLLLGPPPGLTSQLVKNYQTNNSLTTSIEKPNHHTLRKHDNEPFRCAKHSAADHQSTQFHKLYNKSMLQSIFRPQNDNNLLCFGLSENSSGKNNNLEVLTYKRVLTWIHHIDLNDMNTAEELEDNCESIDADNDSDLSDFDFEYEAYSDYE